MVYVNNKTALAYITGVSLGDGNLSIVSRTVRLRVTCDKKYPLLIENIIRNLKDVFFFNKISKINNENNAIDIVVYSNNLEKILGWKAKNGSKIVQKVTVPVWIKTNDIFIKECLRGLFQTDGSIYLDRGYLMINFTSACYSLIKDVKDML